MNPRISSFLLLVIFSKKSRVGSRKARQWGWHRFTSVVCGLISGNFCPFSIVKKVGLVFFHATILLFKDNSGPESVLGSAVVN